MDVRDVRDVGDMQNVDVVPHARDVRHAWNAPARKTRRATTPFFSRVVFRENETETNHVGCKDTILQYSFFFNLHEGISKGPS